MIFSVLFRFKERPIPYFLSIFAMVMVAVAIISCSGGNNSMVAPGMATINVSVSDPPSCAANTSGSTAAAVGGTAAPAGTTFNSVFVTIRSI